MSIERQNFLERISIYAALAAGSALFLWPFLWMVMTSMKSDRELFSGDRTPFPAVPYPQVQSPYVAPRAFSLPEIPRGDALLQVAKSALEQAWPANQPRNSQALEVVANGVLTRMHTMLPVALWNEPEDRVATAVRQFVTPELIAELLASAGRTLKIGALRLRTYDLTEDLLVSPTTAESPWSADGATGKMAGPVGNRCLELAYDLTSRRSFTLTGTFSTTIDLARLHQVQLALCADESWNGVTVRVEMLGKRYESARTIYAGESGWSVLLFQPKGPDDRTNRIRNWVLLQPKGESSVVAPGRIQVSIEVTRTSLPEACWAKMKRNYRLTLDHVPFWRYVSTSLFLVILNLAGTLFSCSLVAYAMARLRWPGREFSFVLMLATLMIPPQVTMIPQFLVMKWLGWYNTLYPLWVPQCLGNAFYIFLLRQFMKGIPQDLEDAARIDGCGFLRIYWHLILPIVRPTLAVIAIFTFMATWNDFMGPLIFISDQRLYPLSFGLYALNVQSDNVNFGMMMAGSILMTLPVVVLFFFCQRYFLKGVTLSGLK